VFIWNLIFRIPREVEVFVELDERRKAPIFTAIEQPPLSTYYFPNVLVNPPDVLVSSSWNASAALGDHCITLMACWEGGLVIMTSLVIMVALGTKFTPGMSDFANAALSIFLAADLVVGYFVYAKNKDWVTMLREAKRSPAEDGTALEGNLVTCPFCKKGGISPRAKACPECSEPLH
jgi:hypothetical protein